MAQYYFGRYVFIDGKLRGVRLATSLRDKYKNYPASNLMRWPKGLMEWAPVPQELTDFLYKNGMVRGREKEMIPIGDFIVEVRNARLGLVF